MPRRKKRNTPAQPRGGKRNGAGRPKSVATIERERDVKAVVLNQPHRLGSTSDWRSDAVGRLLDDARYPTSGLSKKGLYEAANRFAEAYSRWQGVVCSARPFANSAAGGDGDIPDSIAWRYQNAWLTAWGAVRHAGERQEKAVFAAVIEPQQEDWRPPFWIVYGCIEGLKALAHHFGIDISQEDVEAPRAAA